MAIDVFLPGMNNHEIFVHLSVKKFYK